MRRRECLTKCGTLARCLHFFQTKPPLQGWFEQTYSSLKTADISVPSKPQLEHDRFQSAALTGLFSAAMFNTWAL